MADTGYLSPATTGSPSNQWTNGANIKTSNNVYTTERTSGDKLDTSDYSFSITASSAIDGILVEVEAKGALHTPPLPDSDSGDLEVLLSWDGGTSYTTAKVNTISTVGAEVYWTYGGSADTWGRSWAVSEFTNANFRAQVRAANMGTHFELRADHIRVKVFYTPPSSTVYTLKITGAGS